MGKSLVITRPFEQSEPLSSELVNMGAKVVSLPLITITEPVDGGKGLEEKVKDFESSLLSFMGSEYSDLMKEISDSGDYNKDTEKAFKEALDKFISTQSW